MDLFLIEKPPQKWPILWHMGVISIGILTVSTFVAKLENWPLGAALHVVSDALMNNGSGKHHVNRSVTRVILVGVCLIGFFVLIEFLQQLLPSAMGKTVADEAEDGRQCRQSPNGGHNTE